MIYNPISQLLRNGVYITYNLEEDLMTKLRAHTGFLTKKNVIFNLPFLQKKIFF